MEVRQCMENNIALSSHITSPTELSLSIFIYLFVFLVMNPSNHITHKFKGGGEDCYKADQETMHSLSLF